mmetsp:Transcript_22866/g.64750  ORF Transcript_22866/g.64750 Transcript_22866/m.64750 type:complete len:97 (-) Transcript_22866:234-524(-)
MTSPVPINSRPPTMKQARAATDASTTDVMSPHFDILKQHDKLIVIIAMEPNTRLVMPPKDRESAIKEQTCAKRRMRWLVPLRLEDEQMTKSTFSTG